MDHERLFLEHLSTIERLAQYHARRYRLPARERDDFVSLVRLRLMEDNFRILREFEGRSTLPTYLNIVIARLFHDYRNTEWGRWRPSARAVQLGSAAVQLERLIYREGHSLGEAIQILQVNHRIGLSEASIRATWAQLPPRVTLGRAAEDAAAAVASPTESVEQALSRGQMVSTVRQVLEAAVEQLAAEDQALLALHFGRGLPIAQIAGHLKVSRATAHRRLTRSLGFCRTALETAGIEPERLRQVIGDGSVEWPPVLNAVVETIATRGRLTE